MMRQAGAEPIEPFPGTQKRWRCQCMACGREIAPHLRSIRAGQGPCKFCAKQAVDPGEALDGMRASNMEPLDAYPGSRAPWRCRCNTCGREVSPTWNNIRARRPVNACRYCAGKCVDADEAAAAMRVVSLEPLTPYPGSNDSPWPCRCTACSREVAPKWRSIKNGQGGCKYCSGTMPHDPVEASDAMCNSGAVPIVPYPGYSAPWLCVCAACGREVTPCLASIKAGNGPCKYCAPRGFDPRKEGFVYLLLHPALGAVKVGITETSGFRLKVHARYGWQTVAAVRVSGELAVKIEKTVLAGWRTDLGLPRYLGKNEMPQGGWTETVDADAIDIPATVARIRALAGASPTSTTAIAA